MIPWFHLHRQYDVELYEFKKIEFAKDAKSLFVSNGSTTSD